MVWILNLLSVLAAVVWTGIVATLTLIAFIFSERTGHYFHRLWGKGILWLMGVDLTVEGQENIPAEGGLILAPNHESYFDIFVICSLPVNFKWVAKAELKNIPLIGWAMRIMGCYFVQRDGSSRDLNVLKGVEQGLRAGGRILIFPEGTRTRTGELLPLKKGAFRTAQNAGVPLIPIAIQGTGRIARPGQLPKRRGHKVGVRIGQPFVVKADEELRPSMDSYRALLLKLLQAPVNASANSKRL